MKILDQKKIEKSLICFPADELIPYIQRYREQYTKDGASKLLPHITILYPFSTKLCEIEENSTKIETICTSLSPFEVIIDKIDYFEDKQVMYYDFKTQTILTKIIRTFADKFKETPPYGGKILLNDISAHITISSDKIFNDFISQKISNEISKIIPYILKLDKIRLCIKYDGEWINYKEFNMSKDKD